MAAPGRAVVVPGLRRARGSRRNHEGEAEQASVHIGTLTGTDWDARARPITKWSVTKLDPTGMRELVARDRSLPERLARRERARQPIEEKVRIAVALYEAARSARPDWPDARSREEDLANHRRLRALLDRASHVGRR